MPDPKNDYVRLTTAERDSIREGLPHMACPKPGEVGACDCPDVYEAVEHILRKRLADQEASRLERVDAHVNEIKAQALTEAADEMSSVLDRFSQRGRHTRARWAEGWLRDRVASIRGGEATS